MLDIFLDRLNEGENDLQFSKSDILPSIPEELSVKNLTDFNYKATVLGKYIYLDGKGSVTLQFGCDRCAENFNQEIDLNHKLTLHYGEIRGKDRDYEVEIIDSNQSIYDLAPLFIEELFLNVPMIKLCMSECKGLCSECGVDKNKVECDCDNKKPIDPRWEGLAELSKKMNFDK
ncbi:MAG: hypothetical protein CR982_03390 [Candidatus Cloacimonadota bacterium]|nr:MAG: hypothetical protein CR982_03390 [Candidatus Cloacimonadota bacterium]PIE78827.1 MAG: hypothetical protein CSA15_05845 [Candidatus Delongbacteria bacterium]